MARKALDYADMPSHPGAPKTVAKKASARGGVNSFIKGGKGKGRRGHKRHVAK
jgi:hypothetical protein